MVNETLSFDNQIHIETCTSFTSAQQPLFRIAIAYYAIILISGAIGVCIYINREKIISFFRTAVSLLTEPLRRTSTNSE